MNNKLNITFKDTFKAPFSLDEYLVYVWTADKKPAFCSCTQDESLLNRVISKLNGESTEKFDNVTTEALRILINGKPVLLTRGWGRLTGIGGYNLNYEDAIKIQDDFIHWTIETLMK